MGSKVFGVRLPHETIGNLSKEAKKKGMKLSDLARHKLLLATEHEPMIQEFINRQAEITGISAHEIVKIILIDFIARTKTFEEVFGDTYRLRQFVHTREGILGGRKLLEDLKDHHREKFISEKKQKLMKAETNDLEISDEDRAFMIKHHLGRTYLESNEYKDKLQKSIENNQLLHEAKEKGLVPKMMRGPEGIIADYYRRLKAGEITKAQFKEFLENI